MVRLIEVDAGDVAQLKEIFELAIETYVKHGLREDQLKAIKYLSRVTEAAPWLIMLAQDRLYSVEGISTEPDGNDGVVHLIVAGKEV